MQHLNHKVQDKHKMKYTIIPRETKVGVVKAVHDGDSIKVKFEDGEVVWIRLYGCDAPEVVSNHVSANQPYGVEAGKYLRDLMKGHRVEVQTLFRDKYNRMICKANFIYDDLDLVGRDLTELLIETGNAWWLSEPSQNKDELSKFKSLQETAKVAKSGLWGHPGRKIRPSTWRGRNHNPATLEELF